MTATGFDARGLERRYAFLDRCPPALLPSVVTLPVGTLEERVVGTRLWHDSLLAGHLPPPGSWPLSPVDRAVRLALTAMNLARFCRGQQELVDAVLKNLLAAFGRGASELQTEVAEHLRELERLERARIATAQGQRVERRKKGASPIRLDESIVQRLREAAEQAAGAREREPDAEVLATWGERARAWSEIADVFGDLGELLGRGWDLARGVLSHTGWFDLLQLRALLERLPQLRDLIRALGRLHATHDGPSVAETVLAPIRRLEEELREAQTPLILAETRGIERSGEVARMLPSEAVLLGHPQLRLLWHARRAERALLTYRVEGIELERTQRLREARAEVEQKAPRPVRGPIIAVVDTSGSMHGVPERVAKAIVLEVLRTAHQEKRRCFLYAYSGPGQVLEHELDLSADGLGRLLAFIGHSFGGGNDETEVLSRVLARLKENHWQKADVVWVSDGKWPVPSSLTKAVSEQRAAGTRFHGIQIGNHGMTGLHGICELVHEFRDWETAGGGR